MYGLLWSRMVLYGPVGTVRFGMVPYGPIWTRMVPYGPVLSCIVLYGPVWRHMVLFGPVLFLMVWSCLVLFGHLWSYTRFRQLCSHHEITQKSIRKLEKNKKALNSTIHHDIAKYDPRCLILDSMLYHKDKDKNMIHDS